MKRLYSKTEVLYLIFKKIDKEINVTFPKVF